MIRCFGVQDTLMDADLTNPKIVRLICKFHFLEKVLLTRVAYHEPIRLGELFSGLFIVAGIAFVMIGVQTLKIVRANPATVLKSE
jgi:putative ABC transport system permease protein